MTERRDLREFDNRIVAVLCDHMADNLGGDLLAAEPVTGPGVRFVLVLEFPNLPSRLGPDDTRFHVVSNSAAHVEQMLGQALGDVLKTPPEA